MRAQSRPHVALEQFGVDVLDSSAAMCPSQLPILISAVLVR